MSEEVAVIETEVNDGEVPVAVILFDGHNWTLRTVAPPVTEMMIDLKNGLALLAEQFAKEGF